MSRCEKHEEAIGNWCANSPSWPSIRTGDAATRGRIYVSSRTSCQRAECLQARSRSGPVLRAWRSICPRDTMKGCFCFGPLELKREFDPLDLTEEDQNECVRNSPSTKAYGRSTRTVHGFGIG